jgi:precorrin-6B methylase 2
LHGRLRRIGRESSRERQYQERKALHTILIGSLRFSCTRTRLDSSDSRTVYALPSGYFHIRRGAQQRWTDASSPIRYTDIPYVPTPAKVVDAMLAIASVKPGDVLIDLGSGDGRIVVTAAERYGIRSIGIEIIPELVRESEKNAREAGVTDRAQFINGDLFGQDLRRASIVTMFLTPGVNLRLRPKLLHELRPGARVVSRSFNMGNWAPSKTVQVDGDPVYLWVIPDEPFRSE